MKNILSADIGGTNCRFGHFTVDRNNTVSLVESIWLKTSDAGSFSDLMDNLKRSAFSLNPESADIVVIAVAGPVENRVRSNPPLIAWDIDISTAGKDFGFKRCILINDFIAQAFACRSPIAESAETILAGSPQKDAATAVIGAGTGLGKALIMQTGNGRYVAIPSEGAMPISPLFQGRN
jgi:glucokinase